ncbi:hypothetical protein DSCA_49140 [Desulfosarcina alkanivorans]|uniref:HicA protein n=1 Tax=Desulfosarcina alkanivorans TaxID=571177 RepID=A0A5K7YXG4_9BACT|nr:hypothetical protein DSCA_49140 [Desulfosarcina alkanivorans]
MPKTKKNLDFYVKNFSNFSERLPWKYFVKVLTAHYGFEMENSRRGSARLFIQKEIRFTAHEPHGRENFVAKIDRKKAIKFIGLIK